MDKCEIVKCGCRDLACNKYRIVMPFNFGGLFEKEDTLYIQKCINSHTILLEALEDRKAKAIQALKKSKGI